MIKQKFYIIEMLLVIGALGATEIISTSFFWHQIMNNQKLILFRPGELIAQLSMAGVLIGIVGAIIYFLRSIINYLIKKKEIEWLKTSLFALFVLEFIWVVYVGTGV